MVNFCILDSLAIVGSVHFGWAAVFLFWYIMFKLFEVFNVAIHTDVDSLFVIVLFEVHVNILFGIPVDLKWLFVVYAGK